MAVNNLIAAGISAAANTLSNILTNRSNQRMQESVNQANKDLWELQTEYNKPINQVKRYMDAGLNPNLLAGTPMQGGAASSAPQMLASRSESAFNLDPLTAAQVANINADTDLKKQQAGESANRIIVSNKELEINGQRFELEKELTQSQISQIEESINLTRSSIDKMVADTEKVRKEIQGLTYDNQIKSLEAAFQEATKDVRVRQMLSDLKLTNNQIAKLAQELILYPEMCAAQVALMESDIKLKSAQALHTGAQTTYTQSQTKNLNLDFDEKTYKLREYMSSAAFLSRQSEYVRNLSDNKFEINKVSGNVYPITYFLRALSGTIGSALGRSSW